MRDIMLATPGVTEPNLSAEPLATEGEATPGADDYVPFDDPEWQDDSADVPSLSIPEELLW